MNLKQSTAVTIKFGPFLDDGDGKTAETGLTIQKADIRVSKNGGNMAAANSDQGESDAGAAHDELGYYDVSLDTTDTGTLGRLKVMCHKSGALPVWQDFMIVTANVWDTLCGADTFDVNVTSQANIDFGALQKASLNAATPASVVGAVGSVTGAVGSVTGAVGSVTAPVTLHADYDAAKTASQFDASSDEVNVGAINGANVTESSAGNLAAAFSFFFDEGTPTKSAEDIGAVSLSEQDIADIGAAAASGLLSGGTFIKVDAAGRVYTKSFGRRLT